MKLSEFLGPTWAAKQKMAEYVGVNVAQIYRILKGKNKPSRVLAKAIERYSEGKVLASEMLGGKDG